LSQLTHERKENMKTTFYTLSMIALINTTFLSAQTNISDKIASEDIQLSVNLLNDNEKGNDDRVAYPIGTPELKTNNSRVEHPLTSNTYLATEVNSKVIAKVSINELYDGIYWIEVIDRESNVLASTNVLEPLYLKKMDSNESITIVRRDMLTDNLLVYTETEHASTTIINTESGEIKEYQTVSGITPINDLSRGIYIFFTKTSTGESETHLIRIN